MNEEALRRLDQLELRVDKMTKELSALLESQEDLRMIELRLKAEKMDEELSALINNKHLTT